MCIRDRPYGSDEVAALGIALKVNMITMLILVGFAFGAQPLLGYCYGADNRERLKQFLHFDLLVQLLIALVFTAAACIFAPPIIRIFMQDDVIVGSGALMLRCLMITAPVIGMILVFKMCIRDRRSKERCHAWRRAPFRPEWLS